MPICALIDTPLGVMLAAAEEDALTGLWFMGQKYFPEMIHTWRSEPDAPIFALLRSYLMAYFAGYQPPMELPLSPAGTPFQQRVWKALLDIPYGETTTYAILAKQCECNAPLAIGGAVGRNPISILIPCHRVLGSDGDLTGYAGGLERKQALLELEGAL